MKPEKIITEDELPPEVIQAVKEGRKIEAIKILRERSGLGLANAQVLVDRAARTHGPKKSYPFATQQGSGLAGLFKFLCIVSLLVAAYYFSRRF